METFKSTMVDLHKEKRLDHLKPILVQRGLIQKGFTSYFDAQIKKEELLSTLSTAPRMAKPVEQSDDGSNTLIPDPYFASVVNDEGQVQIENTTYMVTEFGTFITPSSNTGELEVFVTNLRTLNTYDQPLTALDNETYVQENLYQVDPEIYRYNSQIDV